MLDLSVAIVSYNTRELLRDCLRSVFACASCPGRKPLSLEVWVVDNASPDGSAAMVRRDFPAVKLIENDANAGFAAATNQALRGAAARHVLLLNPDTVVQGDALQRLIAFLEGHQEVGVVGPGLLNADGSFQHSCFRFPNLWMSFFDFFPLNRRLIDSRLNGRYPRRSYGAPFPIDHPLGACLMARQEVFDQVGLLDEDFYIYCEEIDWCMRVSRAGWEIYCVPEASVVHYGGQSTRQFRGRMLVELHRSRNKLFRKHYGGFFRWMARQIVRLGLARETARDLFCVALGRLGRQELDERISAYWQIFRM
ncbi:MAG: glycosyltransferase family 2 protein [Chloroflexi bacterium]|nr:glycosyltransferase family 2 protein [Chloroflexota bacterium]